MRNRILVAALTAALVAVFAGAVTLSAGASSDRTAIGAWGRGLAAADGAGGPVAIRSHEGGQTLIVHEKEGPSKFINADGPGFGPGDYVVFRNRLFHNGVRVGHDNVMCTFNFPVSERRAAALCEGTFNFYGKGGIQRGKVEVEGTIAFSETTSTQAIAITGGTAHYQNVRGEIHVLLATSAIVLHLLP